ncbi:MAG: DUF1684 domain-containing protein [Acidobacteriota bacterium]
MSSQLKRYLCSAVVLVAVTVAPAQTSRDEDLKYWHDRESWMRSPKSPLALAGLFWLKPGVNRLGGADGLEVRLPADAVPPNVGRLTLEGQRVRLEITDPSVVATLNEKQVTHQELRSDAGDGKPDLVSIGRIDFKVISRGGQLAVRVIDRDNPPLQKFSGLKRYPIRAEFRVLARFTPYQPVKKIQVASITGHVEELICPGVAEFELAGIKQRLEPVYEEPDPEELFFMFKDATNGKETYEGGRYLYTALPEKGQVLLNFNLAHNPYCAYTPYSTCQLPPVQNWLKVPVEAGEKSYQPRRKN